MVVEVAEDRVAELTPDRHVSLKGPGETTLSGFARRIRLAQALDISTCHRPLHRLMSTKADRPLAFIVVILQIEVLSTYIDFFHQPFLIVKDGGHVGSARVLITSSGSC